MDFVLPEHVEDSLYNLRLEVDLSKWGDTVLVTDTEYSFPNTLSAQRYIVKGQKSGNIFYIKYIEVHPYHG